MSEAKMFLDALAKLDSLYALGQVNFFEWCTRKILLIVEIDDARAPVADKALSLWLAQGRGEYSLKMADGEAILAVKGAPVWVLAGRQAFIASDAIIDPSKFAIRIGTSEDGRMYAAGFGVGAEAQLDKMSDCVSRTDLGQEIKNSVINMTVNIDGKGIAGAVSDAVTAVMYPLREECADAAQWLVMNGVNVGCGKLHPVTWLKMGEVHTPEWIIRTGWKYLGQFNDKRLPVADAAWFLLEYGVVDWHNILDMRSADHILYCARARQDTISAKREPIADAAQVLFTVFGYNASQTESLPDPVATLNKIKSKREEFADAARAFWVIAPAPDAGITANRSLDQLVRDARYWRDVRAADYMRDAIAISNGMMRPKASDRIRKIAALLLEEEAAYEGR